MFTALLPLKNMQGDKQTAGSCGHGAEATLGYVDAAIRDGNVVGPWIMTLPIGPST